jgi:carboxyl-terminal processing protease
MSSNASIGLVLAGIAAGSLGALVVTPPDIVVRAAQAAVGDLTQGLNLFGEVFQRVRTDYVVQPDEKSMVRDAIGGMVSGLDPQSAYFTPDQVARAAERPGDTTGTVGMLLTTDDSEAKVVSVVDGSPAAAAGILAGDAIVAINGQDLAGAHLPDVTDALGCGDGKAASVTLLRDGLADPFTTKLGCAAPVSASVTARAEGPVGYVRINRFTSRTAAELKSALGKVHSDIGGDGAKGYVIDLRNNPGGSLDDAVAVAEEFLNGGTVVSVRGRDTSKDRQVTAGAGDLVAGKPLVVLVNGGSAAEAEVVAGALKDDHRATILGARTVGTASVESVIPLGRDGALRLTTARYYTPSGQAIQTKGIEPDITVGQIAPPPPRGLPAQANKPAKTASATTKPLPSPAYIPADPAKDKQLQYALGLVRGTIINPIFPAAPKPPTAG